MKISPLYLTNEPSVINPLAPIHIIIKDIKKKKKRKKGTV